MHFIKDKALAERFKHHEVPSRERFYYLVIMEVLVALLLTNFFFHSLATDDWIYFPINHWNIADDILSVMLPLFGTILLYCTNAKGDDKEFIERYICISFPVIIQTLLVIIAAFGAILMLTDWADHEEGTLYDVLLSLLFYGYYYFRLYKCIKIASGQ